MHPVGVLFAVSGPASWPGLCGTTSRPVGGLFDRTWLRSFPSRGLCGFLGRPALASSCCHAFRRAGQPFVAGGDDAWRVMSVVVGHPVVWALVVCCAYRRRGLGNSPSVHSVPPRRASAGLSPNDWRELDCCFSCMAFGGGSRRWSSVARRWLCSCDVAARSLMVQGMLLVPLWPSGRRPFVWHCRAARGGGRSPWRFSRQPAMFHLGRSDSRPLPGGWC